MNDPLDHLLTPSEPPPGDALRRELLGRTTRALRWKRRRRQIAVAACAAGLLALCLVPPPERPSAPPRPAEVVAQPADAEPVVLEWRALDRPGEAAALYREAADRYLEGGDASEAMRCYANALDEARSLDVNTDDSWLLIAIKHARKKELNP
jgi:hypothetical protein